LAFYPYMSTFIDEKQNEHLLGKLGEFGLSDKEARVYIALLPYRDIGSSKLIRATGLHGQFVYNALEKLEQMGLAKHVVQRGRKKFSANTPARILSLLEERKLSAQTVVKQLQQRFAGAREQDVEIFQGDSAFAAHQINMLENAPEGSAICVIASETDRYELILEQEGLLDEFLKILKERNLFIRYIGAEAQRARLKKLHEVAPSWTYRILSGHKTGAMDTDIWHDNITLNIFGDPVLAITITGTEIAEGYRQFFENLWLLAKE
jgi:sugar-specific transcriptional regulator TrmB